MKSGIQGADVEEAVLVKSPTEFAKIISDKTEISAGSISAILKLLTYNSQLKNNDIVYQPFVEIDDDRLALAPHLILASRPERNLISLIHKLRDKSYFDLTNLREGIMQDELDAVTEELPNILVAKNKSLPDTLPDVDYAIWDKESNSILICELKWLIEADSTPEVFARIQDLEHGCSQVSNMLTYAKNHCPEFCDKVFGIASLDNRNRSIIPRYRKVVVPSTHTTENHDFISSDQGSRSSISKSLLCSARSGSTLSR